MLTLPLVVVVVVMAAVRRDEIQSVVRAPKAAGPRHAPLKKNPLKNLGALLKLNPYAKVRAHALGERAVFCVTRMCQHVSTGERTAGWGQRRVGQRAPRRLSRLQAPTHLLHLAALPGWVRAGCPAHCHHVERQEGGQARRQAGQAGGRPGGGPQEARRAQEGG